ncbi:MAG TPA: hypothetical protein VEC06_04430 [Paucimonas sp.]|nr:hypothetical protein [Paucimonas sp.]
MPLFRSLAGSLLLTAPLVAAQTMEVPRQFNFCSIDIPFPPYAKLDGTGYLQHLVVQAAKAVNVRFDRHVAPRRRCFEEVRTGVADGMIAAHGPDRADAGAFPMRGGALDESRQVGTVRFLVYRRVGTSIDWDGQRFLNLRDGAVGVESAFAGIIDKLKQLGAPYDEGAKTLEQNLVKLVAGRVEAVVAMDLEANKLVMDRFAGKIEALAKPFDMAIMYLMVSKAFQARYPEFTEAYWHAIKDYRNSAEYRQYQLSNP